MVRSWKYLSKTDLRLFLDSPRHLWAKYHGVWHPSFSDFDKKTATDGYRVEKLAMDYLEHNYAVDGKILKKQQTFISESFLVRTDGLIYDPKTDTYDLYEVKSSTFDENEPKLDKTNLYDIAFQSLVLEKNIKVKNYYLLMLNANYRRKGNLDLDLLFRVVKINKEIKELKDDVLKFRQEMISVVDAEECDAFEACYSPGTCGCKEICHPNLPEHNIYEMFARSRTSIKKLRSEGILGITDVPSDFALNNRNERLIQVYKGKTNRLIESKKIKEILASYEYPIYFLDYETVSDPIPQFDGIRPYQNLATQYSLHVVQVDGTITHHEYIYEGNDCPLRYTVEDMIRHVGTSGTILVWNEMFEKGVNRRAAESYPDLAEEIMFINARIKDLGDAFKKLFYIDKNFHCSWSIKKVLPVMCPECSYKELPINHGDQASFEWIKMNSEETSMNEKARIRENLLRYCELDTWAMVRIWQELKKEIVL
ncbi:DUF2779 domain-containing protein [Candidatus Saccharibacteria bacterium]|nr:DUF2779 domain-containing protein [Candidatus Saccharibacteria bacterium]